MSSILRKAKRDILHAVGALRPKKCCGQMLVEREFYDETDEDGTLKAYIYKAMVCKKCGKGYYISRKPTAVREKTTGDAGLDKLPSDLKMDTKDKYKE